MSGMTAVEPAIQVASEAGAKLPAPAPAPSSSSKTQSNGSNSGSSTSSQQQPSSASSTSKPSQPPKPSRSNGNYDVIPYDQPVHLAELQIGWISVFIQHQRRSVPPRPQNKKVARQVKELEDRVQALERLIATPSTALVRGVIQDDVLDEVADVERILRNAKRQKLEDGTAASSPNNNAYGTPVTPTYSNSSSNTTMATVSENKFGIPTAFMHSPLYSNPVLSPPNSSLGSPEPPGSIPFISTTSNSTLSPWEDGRLPIEDKNPMELAISYFSQEQAQFPLNMVHKRTFFYQPETLHPILRYAVLGCGARLSPFLDEPGSDMMQRSENLFQLARSQISHYIDNPHINAVQALLIMVMCSAATNRTSAGSIYLGMAARMALIIKLDQDPDLLEAESKGAFSWNWVEKETRRRTWWAGYVLDRMVAGITKREPILISADEHAVQKPSADSVWESMIAFQDLPVSMIAESIGKESLFRHLWDLIKIYYRVVSFSRKPAFTKMPQAFDGPSFEDASKNARLEFIQLEQDLKHWFESLPEHVKSKLNRINENTVFSETMSGDLPWLAVVIIMTYHGCICILHRPRLIVAIGAQTLMYHPEKDSILTRNKDQEPCGFNPFASQGKPDAVSSSTGGPPPGMFGGGGMMSFPIPSHSNGPQAQNGGPPAIFGGGPPMQGKSGVPSDRFKTLQDYLGENWAAVRLLSGATGGFQGGPPGNVTPYANANSPGAFSSTGSSTPSPTDSPISMSQPAFSVSDSTIASPYSTASSTYASGSYNNASPHPQVSASDYFQSLEACQTSAREIARLVRVIRVTNPTFLHLSTYAGLAIIESTLVLVLLVTRSVECGTPDLLTEALAMRQEVHENWEALKEFARSFFLYRHVVKGVEMMTSGLPDMETLKEMIKSAKSGSPDLDGLGAFGISDSRVEQQQLQQQQRRQQNQIASLMSPDSVSEHLSPLFMNGNGSSLVKKESLSPSPSAYSNSPTSGRSIPTSILGYPIYQPANLLSSTTPSDPFNSGNNIGDMSQHGSMMLIGAAATMSSQNTVSVNGSATYNGPASFTQVMPSVVNPQGNGDPRFDFLNYPSTTPAISTGNQSAMQVLERLMMEQQNRYEPEDSSALLDELLSDELGGDGGEMNEAYLNQLLNGTL
ncbi:hypothetical protein HDV05_007059 [Chytridiales sp. JEL 0842]|nr:hypothetical protein HDV05_007059 [Chytridiales sp. JEL 0842]